MLKYLDIKKKQIYSINTNLPSASLSSINYSKKIKKYFKKSKVSFDLVLLGMGDDGHIASIFPKNLQKKSNKIARSVVKKDFERITINLKIINNSKNIFLWLNTRKRTKIFRSFYGNKINEIPVSYLNRKRMLVFSLF